MGSPDRITTHSTRRIITLVLIVWLSCSGCHLGMWLYQTIYTGDNYSEYGFLADILITVTVADTAVTITDSQTHLNVGDYLFAIGAKIDIDDNTGTGDVDGYDVDILLGRDVPASGDPLTGTWSLGDFVIIPTLGVTEHPVYVTGTTIYYLETTDNAIYATLSPTCRTQVYGMYNPPPDRLVLETDLAPVVVGSGTATDPAGDAAFDFLDILTVEVQMP